MWTGDWDGLLEVTTAGLDENPEAGDRMPYLLQTVVVRAARGEPVAELLDSLKQAAAGVTDPQTLWLSIDALGFVALAEGELAEAGAIYRANVGQYEFTAPGWLWFAAWSAILLGDVPTAEADLEALDAIGGHLSLLDARRTVIRAGLAGLAGEGSGAIRSFETALVELRAIDAVFDEALAGILMASVLEPGAEVQEATDRAREILVRLRAQPFLDQLDAALERQTDVQNRASVSAATAGAVPVETEP